jgi:RNA polymerase sigma-70 factor (ECF subfamily)
MPHRRDAFRSTRWTLVFAAGDSHTDIARAAIADLCETYWYPLYVYVRRSGYNPDDAADIVQSFLLSLWERRDFGALHPSRGRFRAFLLAALKHYIGNRRVHDRALKRGGGDRPVSLDVLRAEGRYQAGPATTDTPESAFERQWAMDLLADVFAELRAEWEARDRAEEFEYLKELVLDQSSASYSAAARELGATEAALRMSASRLRQRFRQCLRKIVAEMTPDEAVDDELRYLLRILQQ